MGVPVHVCIIYWDISITVCVHECVCVREWLSLQRKNPDCGAERRMMDEQVAASNPPLLE